jgi:hypothetical protein
LGLLHISPISYLLRSLTYNLKVDTKADPPRAIWTHPYEDEQYLREHPEVREKVSSLAQQQGSKDSSNTKPSRRHSYNGHDSTSMVPDEPPTSPDSSKKGKEKRGFFGKLKDKAIGTKEEREAYKKEQARIENERQRQRAEMVRAQRALYAQQQARFAQERAQQQALYNQQYPSGSSYQGRGRYGPPPGNPYAGYGPGYGGPGYGYDNYPTQRQQRGGSSALPLLGALAGGLLLGDILGGF